MNKLITILLLGTLILSGCESKRVSLISDIKLYKTFDINVQDYFADNWIITPADVRDEIDIPEDATVESVSIEAVGAEIVVKDDDTAQGIILSGYIVMAGTKPVFFNEKSISLSDVNGFTGINTLAAIGLATIKSKIEEYLKTGMGEPTIIQLIAAGTPAGSKIHIELRLEITGTIKYHYCTDLPFFFDLPKCK
jgi:hypothetical protein